LQYEIEAGGRPLLVTVNRVGDGFAVSVDGRPYHVDFARIDANTLSLIVDSGVPADPQASPADSSPDARGSDVEALGRGAVYDATVTADSDGRSVVLVGATPVVVRRNDRRRDSRRPGATTVAAGPLRITAPMPGRVVRVLVQPGAGVHARQPVVVVEAMKMENELRADRDGAVAEVHVREGMSVDAGALLIVIQ
jgi:biotin carboxyl carrier protein